MLAHAICARVKRVNTALQKIQSAGITLYQDKCEFGKKHLHFLDHIINVKGISTNPNDLSAIIDIESLMNLSILGHGHISWECFLKI